MQLSPDPRPTDVLEAQERLREHLEPTPVLTCRSLSDETGSTLFFKCENFQRTGAFKARGALNTVLQLSESEAPRGVLAHSSGNHGAALAWAAATRGLAAWIVMPENSLPYKRRNVERYGGKVVTCRLNERESTAAAVQAETGATLVHPYDDPRIIAGQGTATLELLAQVPDLDLLVVPIGGGGLGSGAVLAAAALESGLRVWGAEPAGADDARRSWESGSLELCPRVDTIADGLRAPLSARTFEILRRGLAGIVTVDEGAIVGALRTIWERMKILVEPSSSVPLAALLQGKIDVKGRRVGVILSGGNVDLDHLPWHGADEIHDEAALAE